MELNRQSQNRLTRISGVALLDAVHGSLVCVSNFFSINFFCLSPSLLPFLRIAFTPKKWPSQGPLTADVSDHPETTAQSIHFLKFNDLP